MRQLDLGKYRKARVWLDELPDSICPLGVNQEITMSAAGQSAQATRVAVEVFIPLGPRSMYGLLGGEFMPSTNGQLKVNIISSSGGGKLLPSSLASPEDQVWTGLPTEYCAAVKEGVHLAQQEIEAASGELVIHCAAHGEIGSCAAVFKHLAIVLIKLINTQKSNLTDNEIILLFPPSFA